MMKIMTHDDDGNTLFLNGSTESYVWLVLVVGIFFFFVNIKNNKNNMKSTTFHHKTTHKGTCI